MVESKYKGREARNGGSMNATDRMPPLPDLGTSAARLAAVVRDGFPAGFCVKCLAVSLDVPVKDVRDAAQVVVCRPGFRVVERICYMCGAEADDVLMLVAGRSASSEL
jgi:hypothetical protein